MYLFYDACLKRMEPAATLLPKGNCLSIGINLNLYKIVPAHFYNQFMFKIRFDILKFYRISESFAGCINDTDTFVWSELLSAKAKHLK